MARHVPWRSIRFVLTLLAQGASTALAAAPVNDTLAARTVINALPFVDMTNTSEATTDADDAAGCGGTATVWYEFTPTEDMTVGIDTADSSYLTGVNVFTGSPGSLVLVVCLLPPFTVPVTAGTTYFFSVADAFSGPGGDLVFRIEMAPPPVEISVTLDPVDSVDPKAGTAQLHGTVTCSRSASVSVDVSLEQRLGRALIDGFGSGEVACEGTTPWSAVVSGNGLFVGGRATASVRASACDQFQCSFDEAAAAIRLIGRR